MKYYGKVEQAAKNWKRHLCKLILLGMLMLIEEGVSLSKGKFQAINRC